MVGGIGNPNFAAASASTPAAAGTEPSGTVEARMLTAAVGPAPGTAAAAGDSLHCARAEAHEAETGVETVGDEEPAVRHRAQAAGAAQQACTEGACSRGKAMCMQHAVRERKQQ